MKKISLLIVLISSCVANYAQKYGNEWVNYNQKYFKIKIGVAGVYHIDYTTLIDAAIEMQLDLGQVNPRKWQMFYQGKEVPIYVAGENDNQFNNNDYIEFYAKTNDGLLDKDLYSNPSFQPQPSVSMFTDSSAYFLTYLSNASSQIGWHMKNYSNTQYGNYAPQSAFTFKSPLVYSDIYNTGKPFDIAGFNFVNPEYLSGEGLCSAPFGFNQSSGLQGVTKVINCKFISEIGNQPRLQYTTVGTNEYKFINIDHRIRVSISPDNNNFTTIQDTSFEGYSVNKRAHSLPRSYFGVDNAFLKFEAVFVNNVPSQGHAISNIELEYPRLYNLDNTSSISFNVNGENNPRHIEWENYQATRTKPIVYDFTNGYRIRGEKIGGNKVRLMLPPTTSASSECFINDSNEIRTVNSKQIESAISFESIPDLDWINFNPNTEKNSNRLVLLTNKRFVGVYTDNYINLRQQSSNTSPAKVITVQQLYNNFSYGIAHPIAIRRYIRFLKENGDTSLKYLFLVGRGYQTDLIRPYGLQNFNWVPSIGTPASDNMFGTNIKDSALAPVVAIGRLTIDKPYELGIYTEKLKSYLSSDNDLWKKEVLHLGGGEDGAQANNIKLRLNAMGNYVTGLPFGGKVTTFSKSATGISEPYLKQRGIETIEAGKQLVTFLGHGSRYVTDIDLGDTSEYNNKGKYPIYYFNGCSIGNPCLIPDKNVKLSGENYVKAHNKGAIAFLAQTGLTELNYISNQMTEFYKLAFSKNYNGFYTLGDAVKDALSKNYGNPGDQLNIIISRILFLQGDPSIPIFQPQFPDYAITNKSFFLNPKNVTALSDSFALAVIIDNKGKYVADSFNVNLVRTYPNDFLTKTYNFKVPGVKYKDTFYLYIKSKDLSTAGDNKFVVIVNDQQSTDEGTSYANNKASYNVFIPGNGINLIYPKRYDIVSLLPNDTIELVVQALNIFESNYQFIYQIDTIPFQDDKTTGVSPWFKEFQSPNIVGQLQNWQTKLLGIRDSIVYYWRAKLNTSSIAGGTWVERSFIHIFNNAPGWSQSHFPQFLPSSSVNGVVLDKALRQFKFNVNAEYVYVQTATDPFPNYGIKKGGPNGSSLNPGAKASGILAVAFDQNTLQQMTLKDIYNPNVTVWNNSTQQVDYLENAFRYYNFTIGWPSGNPQFARWVDSLPEGTYVALCNRYGLTPRIDGAPQPGGPEGFTPNVLSAFSKLGCKLIQNLQSSQTSYAMIGKKGAPIGWAVEDTGIWYSSTNDQSYIEIQKELTGRESSGTLKTELIGPSSGWEGLYFHTKTSDVTPGDDFYINVHGVTNSGKDSICLRNVKQNDFDLSGINNMRFPQIYLEGVFKDKANFTPAQLKHWRVTSKDVPEGALNPNLVSSTWRDSLKQGEIFKYELAFQNISEKVFINNMKYQVRIFNIDTKDTIYDSTFRYPNKLLPTQFFKIPTTFNTKNLRGRYAYLVKVNFDKFNKAEIPELSLINNSAVRYFEIIEDKINPLLDVTFNGRHIANGEIVSANPTIFIQSKDENVYNWQTDTNGIKLWWKKPNSTVFERINLDSFEYQFTPATSIQNLAKLEFKPKNLAEGIYTLKVQSNDVNLNNAGSAEYQINFTVINAKSATNFYPYPNPFTSSMRFVFTLTGSEVPDYINVKIMTIQGKVVKELNKDDLGNIHIGSNITDVVWDGTDEYGDRLANGVYLYTVTIKSNGEEIGQLASDSVSNDLNADKANNKLFKHQMGKIVLLR